MERLTRKTFFGDYALEEDNEKAKNTAFNKLGRIEDFEEKIGYPVEEFLWVIEDKIKEWEEIRKEYLKERGDKVCV